MIQRCGQSVDLVCGQCLGFIGLASVSWLFLLVRRFDMYNTTHPLIRVCVVHVESTVGADLYDMKMYAYMLASYMSNC